MGIEIDNEMHALLLLGLLLDSWETLVISLSNFVSKLTMDTNKDDLLNKEAMRKERMVVSLLQQARAHTNKSAELGKESRMKERKTK